MGDIHGCKAQLVALHAAIVADLAARPIGAPLLVHLGDYIDLGPDSAGVIELLAAGSPVPGLSVINLRGDHEHMLLQALDGDRAAATDWLWSGGREALPGWGVAADLPREDWAAALPAAHIAFLRNLKWSHREGDYLFVHARDPSRRGAGAAGKGRPDDDPPAVPVDGASAGGCGCAWS